MVVLFLFLERYILNIKNKQKGVYDKLIIKGKIEKTESISTKSYISILKGIGIAMVITFIFLFILAIVLPYTNVSDDIINPTIIIITAISILIGSSISNIKIKKNGLINGGIIGGVYIILLYLFSSVFSEEFSLNIQSIIMIVTGIIFGILGGIIGVNVKS